MAFLVSETPQCECSVSSLAGMEPGLPGAVFYSWLSTCDAHGFVYGRSSSISTSALASSAVGG